MSLHDDQLHLAGELRAAVEVGRHAIPGLAITAWVVEQWAATSLASMAPVTSYVLALAGRFDDEVRRELVRDGRPASVHAWADRWLGTMALDRDPAIAGVAARELASGAPRGTDEATP